MFSSLVENFSCHLILVNATICVFANNLDVVYQFFWEFKRILGKKTAMWKSPLDLCLTGVIATLLVLNINTITVLGAPVEDGKEKAQEENENAEYQKTEDAGSTTPCWETENFTFIGSCDPCHPLASKVFTDSCSETGFQQLVHCSESNQKVFKSCPRSRESIEKSFWVFEGVMLLIGLFACLVVFVRRRKLNHEAAERVRKQIANSA